MGRIRYQPRPLSEAPTEPFIDAESAWFWFMRCHRLRVEGAMLSEGSSGGGDQARPCEPDDLYRSVMGLYRRGVLRRAHLKVLEGYGLRERSPDRRCRAEERDAMLWDEALDRLTTVLRTKGIIE